MLTHVDLLINQHFKVLLLRAAFSLFSTQSVFILGIAPAQMQHLALGFLELHKGHTGPHPEPVQVLLDDIPSLHRVDYTIQFGVTRTLGEGALKPTVHVAKKNVK